MELSNNGQSKQTIRDLGLAAALVTSGSKITRTQTDSRRVYFLFEDTAVVRDAISQYWADTLEVPARSFAENIKLLKNQIYALRQEP